LSVRHIELGQTERLPLHDSLRQTLISRLDAYDITDPEAEHLRPHQVEAVQGFVDNVRAIVSGEQPNEGMSLLHPTGSGKTVDIAEIARMLSSEKPNTEPLNVLTLVPGYRVLDQTVGDEEDIGVIRAYAPGVSVAEYSGKSKSTDARVTVMNYQSLRGAVRRGDINVINPGLIICDEGHHVIDGVWAEDVAEISQGRLLLGMTSTPAYSESRDIRNLFPVVLVQKTLKEGIEEGILSEMRGFLYKGSEIHMQRSSSSGDFNQKDVIRALAESKDNYLAAAICAGEVAQGRRGVIRCAPGFDRAHSKIMAKILSNTPVNTPEGQRYIRAAHVDGEIDKESLKAIIRKYNDGQLDVLTYTRLLLEGWDSPTTEFGVMLSPTKSPVLEEQSIGRLVRPLPGKIATLHEVVYDIKGDRRQVTHLDILEADKVRQGRRYGGYRPGPAKGYATKPASDTEAFDIDKFVVNSGLIAAISADNRPSAIQETRIDWEKEGIPYDWRSSTVLARILGSNRAEVDAILSENAVPALTIDIKGVDHTYHAPDAIGVLAPRLGIVPFPDGPESPLTLDDLLEYTRNNSPAKKIRAPKLYKIMELAGVTTKKYLVGGNRVVEGYPFEHRDVAINGVGYRNRSDSYRVEEDFDDDDDLSPGEELTEWLKDALVDPATVDSRWRRQQIIAAQSCLVAAVKEGGNDWQSLESLTNDIAERQIEPTPQMKKLMQAKSLGLGELLVLAKQAQAKFEELYKVR
jgi:ATP-dependent helicase IRC3